MMHIVLLAALAYVGLALFVMFTQRKLIYVPTRMAPALASRIAADEGLLPWRNARGEIIGWRCSPAGPARGSVLIVHGNAGCALDRKYLAEPITQAAPMEAFILEFPGYGARAGTPSQKSLLAAADEAFERMPATGPIYLVSESLGAGVVAHVAKVHPERVAGLVCFAPYDRLASVGQRHLPFLPVSLLLWDRFKPAEWLETYRGPIWSVVAGADDIIPADLGRRFHDRYAGPKHLQVIADAGHNDISGQSVDWWRGVFRFWEEHRPR